jgi:hypothetical protein
MSVIVHEHYVTVVAERTPEIAAPRKYAGGNLTGIIQQGSFI